MGEPSITEPENTSFVTFYELSLETDEPLTGCQNYEAADLREAFEEVQPEDVIVRCLQIDVRVQRARLQALLKKLEDADQPWIDLRLKIAQRTGRDDQVGGIEFII